jgi:hypothetical protein
MTGNDDLTAIVRKYGSNSLVFGEIELAIEQAYPIAEGKPFISTGSILIELWGNPVKYSESAKIKTKSHLRRLVTAICGQYYHWVRYNSTKTRGFGAAVFIRPEVV